MKEIELCRFYDRNANPTYIFLMYCPQYFILLYLHRSVVECPGDNIYFNCQQTFVEVRDPFTQEHNPAGQLDVTGLKTAGELVF